MKDCEEWFGKKIEITQSPYKSVENACLSVAYVNGPKGAACTNLLKRRVRQEWEGRNHFFNWFNYVWGMDLNETERCERLEEAMPDQEHIFSLIESGLTKEDAHKILKASGIKRPAMYDLGYQNNNCISCVKGGMAYHNRIRVDFPEAFEARAKMERKIGASCINGVYLDELDPERGRDKPPIVEDCGIFCETMAM